MMSAQPIISGGQAFHPRSYGRAGVMLPAKLTTPFGSVPCTVLDVSLGGARLEANEAIEPGAAVWLELHKARVFGTVRWRRSNSIGMQFDAKLPKAFVLSLRGEHVDPSELEAVEAMLAAKDWVAGSSIDRPTSLRRLEVLGSQNKNSKSESFSVGPGALMSYSDPRKQRKPRTHIDRKAVLLITLSAVLGSAVGVASVVFAGA